MRPENFASLVCKLRTWAGFGRPLHLVSEHNYASVDVFRPGGLLDPPSSSCNETGPPLLSRPANAARQGNNTSNATPSPRRSRPESPTPLLADQVRRECGGSWLLTWSGPDQVLRGALDIWRVMALTGGGEGRRLVAPAWA